MKRAIAIAADYRFMSAVVGKDTASVIRAGDRVKVAQPIDVDGDGSIIPRGESGTVLYVDQSEMGYVEIIFDRAIAALCDWRNILLLVPFETPDYIQGLALDTVQTAINLVA